MMREFLDKIFCNRKTTTFIPIIISLLIYILLIFLSEKDEKYIFMLIVPFMSIFCYFGVFLVVYIQIKNPLCPEKFLDFFETFATVFSVIVVVGFTIFSLIEGVQYLLTVILACMIFSSLSWVHSKRNLKVTKN